MLEKGKTSKLSLLNRKQGNLVFSVKDLVLCLFKGIKGEIFRHFVPQNDSGELFNKLEFAAALRALAKLLDRENRFLTRPTVTRLFSSCHSEEHRKL